MKKATRVEFINPPSSLKDRVVSYNTREPDFIAAQRAVESMTGEFTRQLTEDFKKIDQAYEGLKADSLSPVCKETLFDLVHDLKGIAGTFDYMLLSVIGNDLCRFLEHAESIEPQHLTVIDYHISAMKKVFREKMTGLDHTHGKLMIDALHRMTQKALREGALEECNHQ